MGPDVAVATVLSDHQAPAKCIECAVWIDVAERKPVREERE